MRLARVLGAIGRALISAGVIVLLFVAYQLWGTGLQHSQAQGSLEDDFLELLDSDAAREVQLTSADDTPDGADDGADETDLDGEGAAAAGDDEPNDADQGDDEPDDVAEPEITYSKELLELIYPPEGDSLARIVIPAINVDQITVEGVSVEDLRKGPGHYPSTPNPGQAGNAAIAGHRTTYGAPFHRVDELEPGDEIIVTTIQGTFTYEVRGNQAPDGTEKGYFIVSPSDTWVLGQESGENLLTLTACHPKYSARQRIIVQAELVGEPAVTPPRDDDTELEPVEISAGAEDERAAEADAVDAVDGDAAAGADVEQVMGDDVAADDDPSVDADGNPIDASDDTDDPTDSADAETTDGDSTDVQTTDTESGDTETGEAEVAAAAGDATDRDDIELTAGASQVDEDFGEGLDGDRTKIKPAILWGVAGGFIWLAAWFIGHRLNRKWTLYLFAVVPFAPVLWSCFVNIDQALPSY